MWRNRERVLGGEQGSVLITALLVLFATGVIGSTVAMLTTTDLKIAGNQQSMTEALFVAEAGVSEALHRLSLENPTYLTVGGQSVNAAIGDAEPYDPNWRAEIVLAPPSSEPQVHGSTWITGTLQDPGEEYVPYSANAGSDDVISIEHKWEDLDGDGVRDPGEIVLYDPRKFPRENFETGMPVEIVTVTGRAGVARRVLQMEVAKNIILPLTLGAMYTDKKISIKTSSKSYGDGVCGYDHDPNIPLGLSPNACFAYHVDNGNDLPGMVTTGGITKLSNANVTGWPRAIDDTKTNPFLSLADVLGLTDKQLADLLAHPDHTSITSPMHGITYIDGKVDVKQDITGSGLLYVTDDIRFDGDLHWRGVIYAEKMFFAKHTWVLGTLVSFGRIRLEFPEKNRLWGSDAVLYSSTPLQISRGREEYTVLTWREL